MISTVLQVALGGAIGASARYLAGIVIVRSIGHTTFPVAILSVNVLGSFFIGAFVVVSAHKGLTHLSPFLVTGVLGGFTTFSAFSLEAITLYERGDFLGAALYVAASVVLSLLGLMVGLWVTRGLFA